MVTILGILSDCACICLRLLLTYVKVCVCLCLLVCCGFVCVYVCWGGYCTVTLRRYLGDSEAVPVLASVYASVPLTEETERELARTP